MLRREEKRGEEKRREENRREEERREEERRKEKKREQERRKEKKREQKEIKECQTLLSMSLTGRIHHGIIGMECVGVVFVRMTSHIQNQAPDIKKKEMNTAVKK